MEYENQEANPIAENEGATVKIFEDWHLRKEVSIGQLVTVICALIAGAIGWTNLNNRMDATEATGARLELQYQAQSKNFQEQIEKSQKDFKDTQEKFETRYQNDMQNFRTSFNDQVRDIKTLLMRVDDKLDRKADK